MSRKTSLHRKTKRLIVRPLSLSDFVQWKIYFSSMSPQLNKWGQQ